MALTAAVSCSREEVPEKYGVIHFTAIAGQDGGLQTRAYFGSSINDGRKRIYFDYGDRAYIWAPDAINVPSAGRLFTNPGRSYELDSFGTFHSIDDKILYWGDASTHTFYGKYPDPSWTSSVPTSAHPAFGKQDPKSDNFLCWLPSSFSVSSGVWYSPQNRRYTYDQDLQYCYMTAYASVPRSSAVELNFIPAVSTFKITIAHTFSGTVRVNSVKLSSESHRLSGEYTVNIGSTTTYSVREYDLSRDDRSVAAVFVNPVTLSSDVSLCVTLFTCPVTVADLTVTIDTSEGSFVLPLKSDSEWISFPAGKYFDITCNQVHDDPVFSVAEDRQVRFSPGNLVYWKWRPSEAWRFAIPQYDDCSYWGVYPNYDAPYNQAVMHFGWGTSGHDGVYPYLTSGNDADYGEALPAGSEFPREWDWGVNTIYNGAGYTWRTLTIDEWGYLFGRTDAQGNLLFAAASVINNAIGIILFPDNFEYPDFEDPNSVIKACGMCQPSANSLTTSDWSDLELQGCVFLPAWGMRRPYTLGGSTYHVDGTGNDRDVWICWYWSSSTDEQGRPLYWTYQHYASSDDLMHLSEYGERHDGCAVRLVRDVN